MLIELNCKFQLTKECNCMDKETSKWLAIISIVVAILIILFFLLSGFELSGFEIHKGIKIN